MCCSNSPERFFAAHRVLSEFATQLGPGFGIRFTVQFNLFAGTVTAIGSDGVCWGWGGEGRWGGGGRVSIRFTVQFNLFAGTVTAIGSDSGWLGRMARCVDMWVSDGMGGGSGRGCARDKRSGEAEPTSAAGARHLPPPPLFPHRRPSCAARDNAAAGAAGMFCAHGEAGRGQLGTG